LLYIAICLRNCASPPISSRSCCFHTQPIFLLEIICFQHICIAQIITFNIYCILRDCFGGCCQLDARNPPLCKRWQRVAFFSLEICCVLTIFICFQRPHFWTWFIATHTIYHVLPACKGVTLYFCITMIPCIALPDLDFALDVKSV